MAGPIRAAGDELLSRAIHHRCTLTVALRRFGKGRLAACAERPSSPHRFAGMN